MRDVAALAGVSLKTVSRVVNREAGVSPELIERVERAAEQLHYRPNLGARSLRRADGRTATIGVVLDDLSNPFSAMLHRAIEEVARERGVAVLAGSADETIARERSLVGAFAARRVDGLILMPSGPDQSYLANELSSGTALVFVDRPPRAIDADAVLTDNHLGAVRCVEHLIAHGHREIAFLGDRRSIITAVERHQGYSEALGRAGLAAHPDHVMHDLAGIDDAERASLALLNRRHRPTALFTAQNLVSIGALRALRAMGLQHHIAMAGFDDLPLADLIDPAVTVVAQNPHEIGRRAAGRLFARIDGDVSRPGRDIVATRLVIRGSGEIPPGR